MGRRLHHVAFAAVMLAAIAAPRHPRANQLASGASPANDALTLQVLLDRAGFSPGEIDGRDGANTQRALAAFRASSTRAPVTPEDVLAALGAATTTPTVTYVITAEDVRGPFTGRIPDDMMGKAKLSALGYTSAVEALGERFHASPALLRRLNPTARFAAGETITVPNILARSAAPTAVRAARVTVSKSRSEAIAYGADGAVIFFAPVTSGSEFDPLPLGEWAVTAVVELPPFHYNPDLFWDADPSHAKAKIAPGPNNPVGVVWIDISKEHYGLHGTPEPSKVGHTTSHGCVRLTNWDARRLAGLVAKGTPVSFIE